MSDEGYIDLFKTLELSESANPGEVRKTYKRKMKKLVMEIARAEITEERRAHFLLEMAKLNVAVYVLRDKEMRDVYWNQRSELISLEEKWRAAAKKDPDVADEFRKEYDGMLRSFLSRYVEEVTLEAGRDKECVEASHWDPAHERHAFRLLRHYRHRLYNTILERLPYYEVTPPEIDWDDRAKTIAALIAHEEG